MKTYDWIVIGGGITGAALSYELVQQGFAVLLLEKDAIPHNATYYSYGGLAYWSGTTDLTRQLCQEGITRHRLLSQELNADTEFRELDLLLTIEQDENPEVVAASYAEVAIPPQLLSVDEACELEPLLNQDAIAGALTVKHGHIHAAKIAEAYIQAFLHAGGTMYVGQVWELLREGQRITGVKTKTNTYHSANTVVCAGGFSRALLKSAGVSVPVYFTHTEIIATPPVDIELRTLVMPANLKRFQLEAESTKDDSVWDVIGEPLPPILDAGAIQFRDRRLYIGQISRTIAEPFAPIDAMSSEAALRNSIGKILPKLKNLPGTWHHCLVAFSSDRLPLIGAIPNLEGIHIFSGFSNPLILIPPLAQRFAHAVAGQHDEIILQLTPQRS
ncbi:NAD(P)/FAD-dependent oxidoreductase [Gloeocapsopsis dulcis]|uniref:FAD-dependent oxidoreductase n=1 Tax=Gloeocapsopsis dulcis AAB1 = 1H9 TaxID=1433147 RepID=A0A6N8G0T4_9CHRO|nr:FAD-binding oxidoreductase [Gloeocapsopsis dulcis]MUL37977.1 FAD-dependent oxidoreductase [Gloeocapsopsis dulcis AAB1 = 1H9]WNN91547.1 FAD-binding oxidoreductase [Gloeocapsopsis dulcis]